MNQNERIAELEAQLAEANKKIEKREEVVNLLGQYQEDYIALLRLLIPNPFDVIRDQGRCSAHEFAKHKIQMLQCLLRGGIGEARTIYVHGQDDKQCAAARDIALKLGVDLSKE